MTALSIVVPVYNAEAHLPALLAGLAAQTARDVEFVLVDDGSTDASASLVDAFARSDARARVIRQSNGGPSRARNAGIAASRGEAIAFADADDWVAPELAAEIIAAFAARSIDVLCFNGRRIDSRGQLDPAPFYRKPKGDGVVSGEEWIARTVEEGEFLQYLWLLACRRELALRTPFPTDIVHEDILFTCELLLAARRVGFLDRELYRYRTTPQSLMREATDASLQRRIDGYFAVVERLLALARRDALPAPTVRALQRHAAVEAGHVFRLASRLQSRPARDAVRARAAIRCFPSLMWRHARGFAERRRAARAALQCALARRAPAPEPNP